MRRQVTIILLCASSLCACKKEAPPPPPPEDPTLARIKVSAAGVSLGAEPVLPTLEDNDKLPHPLIDKLKERKKNFQEEHPTQTFIGRTEIDVEPGSSCRAVMNVV